MTSSLLFNITTLLYLASMLTFFAALANRTKQFFGTAGSYIAFGGLFLQIWRVTHWLYFIAVCPEHDIKRLTRIYPDERTIDGPTTYNS